MSDPAFEFWSGRRQAASVVEVVSTLSALPPRYSSANGMMTQYPMPSRMGAIVTDMALSQTPWFFSGSSSDTC